MISVVVFVFCRLEHSRLEGLERNWVLQLVPRVGIFHPFLAPRRPFFKAFWEFPTAKTGHHRLKSG